MPLFISEEEFQRCSSDGALVAEKADAFIRLLYNQIETVKAEADATSITLEQTCSVIEQKYVSLSAEFSSLQSQHSELTSSLEQRTTELGQVQSEKQQLQVQSIEKDGEIERLMREASELHKSKRQLMEMLEQKDLEVSEKNAVIKNYLDKIVNLTEKAAAKEARIGALESELGQLHATSARLSQEKELLERHNTWLNEELTAKVQNLIQLRKEKGELEADLSSKLADVEKKLKESSNSLRVHKDMVVELEEKLASIEGDLLSTKGAAATAEQHFSSEISTVTKLVDLYKESSEEWSKKAGELEGVIKALETHLNQVQNEYKDSLEKEVRAKREAEKDYADLKEKLLATEEELETLRKENELRHIPLSSYTTKSWEASIEIGDIVQDDRAVVPRIPSGVSGTALAASLLRDGWSLAKMYAKYQEAVDALRHEQLGRKQTQAILERVLYEIEEKAGVIMDEREEHERLVEAYSALNQKLQHSLSEHSSLETTIQDLKATLKRQERDYVVAHKEIDDLQKQVAVLLKECRDVQLRCGAVARGDDDGLITGPGAILDTASDVENIISERLLTFKDIHTLVEQNVHLRSLVRNLSHQIEDKEAELKEMYEKKLEITTNETKTKVNAVLQRVEEQAQMIESLHTSVAMYKKLYEEQHKLRSSYPHPQGAIPELQSREILLLHESSQDASTKVQEKAFERVKVLEENLSKSGNDIKSLRSERDKFALEAQFAQEKLERFMKEFDHLREEQNRVSARNVELSQLIVDYQRRLREISESIRASEELSQKLNMEVAILKHEKEILQNSEKRAHEEVRSLSERVHRLQADLGTLQSTEEVREEARGIERRKQEDYVLKIEREWAEAKRELQEERDRVRKLTLERECNMKDSLRQVEELNKELASSFQSLAAAESRAAVAEARCSDLEKIIQSARTKDSDGTEAGPSSSSSEKILANFQDEIERLRGEAQESKDHMLQYKSIAQVNEAALKQMELAHESFRNEADEVKRSLEAELYSLRERVNELENECKLKVEEAISARAEKEEALTGALSEIANLKDDCAVKMSKTMVLESQISALKEDLEKEHQSWRIAQDNYQRQVILQSESIQELTKTSQALASAQEEISELQKVVNVLKTENSQMKSTLEAEKLAIEVYRNEADKKYKEVDELNKILHCRLEALNIKLAEKEHGTASGNSSQALADDGGLQKVVNHLRRSNEIAETEISLLKQEKHRLHSQLEIALKSAEAAQTLLHSERSKSRASLFTEEEFKSLQLQVREITLLRESNVQLREENRQNFEECQKLREGLQNARIETENLQKLLQDRETELESCRKEIENLKMDKINLEKRVAELVEKCKDVNIDDYNRLRESFQQMQVSLREKVAELDEIKKVLLEKQDAASHLEQDLAQSRNELNERDNRIAEILQTETSTKSEVARVRRINDQLKKKSDNLSKEKEDLSKELQVLSKQLDDARQVKRNSVDSASEQALRENIKEKDTRIQILERTLERHREDMKKKDERDDLKKEREDLKKEKEDLKKEREDLKKEKEDHDKVKEKRVKFRKTILDAHKAVTQDKAKLLDELKKHKQALRMLQDEVEKLRNPGASQSESTPEGQHFPSMVLEDFASVYFQSVDHFEQLAQPAFSELSSATSTDGSLLDNDAPSAGALIGQARSLPEAPVAQPSTVVPSTRMSEEKEREPPAKVNVKMGRKLMRPKIGKPKETQGDVEMSEADKSNTGASSQNAEGQRNLSLPTTVVARNKRPLVSSSSELQDGMVASEETGSDMPAPLLKKTKPSESLQEVAESTKVLEIATTEESPDDVGNGQQGIMEEPDDSERDEFETAVEQLEEPTTGDEQIQVELLGDPGEAADEKLDKPIEAILSDDQLRDQADEDIQQIVTESGADREEGELVGDFADNDGDGFVTNEMTGAEIEEFQADQTVEQENSPITESALEAGEIEPEEEEKNEGGDMTENSVDSSNKPKDGADSVVETDLVPGASTGSTAEVPADTAADIGTSEQGRPTPTPDSGGKPGSPVSGSRGRTINWQERARERASLRQAGIVKTPASRGRTGAGRARGGARGGRSGRGQSPG